MWLRPFRHLMLALGIGFLLVGLVGLAVYLRRPAATLSDYPSAKSDSSTIETAPFISPAEVAAAYDTGYKLIVEQLRPILASQLTAADMPGLGSARDQLVALTVPSKLQSRHLQMVLKLSLLNELLKSTRVTVALSRGVPTVAKTQQDLLKLLNDSVKL